LILIREFGDELGECYEKLIRQDKVRVLVEEMRLANIIAIAISSNTKAGNRQYNRWQRNKATELEDVQKEETLTVFEKLRKSTRSNTIFSRIQFMAGKK